jgi:hypothetical protein
LSDTTIKTTDHALEEVRKSLKELYDKMSSRHTVPERKINFNNPSRWAIAKGADNPAHFCTANVGDDMAINNATKEEGVATTVNVGITAYPSKALGAFLRKHLPRLHVKRILLGGALFKIEMEIADCFTEHFDEISTALFIHSKVNTRGYQTIMNILYSKHGPEGLVGAVLPYGTKLPMLMSIGVLRRRMARLKEELGVDVRVE